MGKERIASERGRPAGESEEEPHSIIDQLPVGVGTIDVRSRTVLMNAAGLRMHGFESADDMFATLDDYVDSFELRYLDGRPIPVEEWPAARALRGEYVRDYEVRFRRLPSGEERVVSYSTAPAPGKGVAFVMNDITERKRSEDDLRRAYGLIEGITRGTEDLIAAEDREFRYLYFNEAYRREFKKLWGEDLQVGTSMVEAMAPWPEEQKKARDLWARALGGETFRVTMDFGPSEGEKETYDLRFNPILDARGEVVGAAHIFRNVTERIRAQQALREANQRKDEFLAMLGHELRNPLATVRGATELLKRLEMEDPHLQRAVDVLERQSSHMVRLVDGLLEVSRIARGKIELRRRVLDIRKVLEGVLEDRRDQLAARGLKLEKDFPDEPRWVRGDAVRLAQVFDNLVGNAIKFSEPGGHLAVAVQADDEWTVVRVRDTGLGIQPDQLSHIFEPFHQEAHDMARVGGGLGLGLALAKSLVDLHQGTIEASSAGPGTGTELRVRLPRAPCPTKGETREKGASHAPPSRILLVEDNADAAEMLSTLLGLHGHHARVVSNASDALDALRADGTDVVLTDLGLPGMSGYELAHAIRDDPSLRDVSLVAVTGYGQPEDRRRTADAGFDAHLIKPVALDALEQILTRLRAASG